MTLQKGLCAYCGDPLVFLDKENRTNNSSQWRPTIDHIVPKSKGGKDVPDNWVLAHSRCNSVKGNLMPDDILKLFKNMRKTFTTLAARNKKMEKLSEKGVGAPPPPYVHIPKKLKPLPKFKIKNKRNIEMNWEEVDRRKKLYEETAEAATGPQVLS